MMKKYHDVVIIGSGLTGGLAADHFTRLGRDVCIIERGGDYRPTRDNHWREKHIQIPETKKWITCASNDPYERTEIKVVKRSPSFKYNMKFGVGGSGAVWSGAAFRRRPNDFKLYSTYGVGADWPVTYDDLEPWYELAEKELGVCGADPFNLWPRNAPFPMKPFRTAYIARVFEKYFGDTFPLMPIPCAIAPEKYRGRGPCIGAGTCVPFCPTEARYAPLQNHLGAALARNNCTLYKRTMVTGLDLHEKTDRIKSVSVFPEGNERYEICGNTFFLAANAVENTRLLLYSTNKRFPQGLSNRNGLLGRYFMSTGSCVFELMYPEFTYPNRGRPITSVCAEFSDGFHRRNNPAFFLEVWSNVWSHGSLDHHMLKLIQAGHWGGTLKKEVEKVLSHAMLSAPFEILPRKENTITLDRDDRDHFGIPLPVSNINYGEYEYSHRRFLEKKLKNTAPQVHIKRYGFGTNGNHPYGTYRMGRNSEEGVVDENLRSFDHENLYILGGGSFVTGGCFNPTLTIAALTFKCIHSVTGK